MKRRCRHGKKISTHAQKSEKEKVREGGGQKGRGYPQPESNPKPNPKPKREINNKKCICSWPKA
jgi:hypothetical protein